MHTVVRRVSAEGSPFNDDLGTTRSCRSAFQGGVRNECLVAFRTIERCNVSEPDLIINYLWQPSMLTLQSFP